MRRWAALAGVALGLLAGGTARAACQLERIIELPITMEGSRPVFDVKVNGRDARLMADSGSFFSLLSPAGAAALGLKPEPLPDGFTLSGAGGLVIPELATVKSLQIGSGKLPDAQFLVGGSDVAGAHAAGVMGQNLLGVGDAEYDFAGGVIRLFRPRGCGGQMLAYWAAGQAVATLELEPRETRQQPFIIGTVLVNGARLRALFDTGAPVTMLSLRAARRVGIRMDGPDVRAAGYGGGIGAHVSRAWVAKVASVDIGGEQIRNTELLIGDTSDETDMLVGVDFFLSHHVYVANSQDRMFFTYIGGPVFKAPTAAGQAAAIDPANPAAPSDAADAPKDADGFSRRGAGFAARRDYVHAEADFTRAVELAPKQAQYLSERATVRLAQKRTDAALADLDAALALQPDDYRTRVLRASVRLSRGDRDGALSDLQAASTAAPKSSELRLQMGGLYSELGRYGDAVTQYDLWMTDHEDDGDRASALNGRCWARALMGQALDRALADCNAAVRVSQGDPEILDSRGLVHLRRGEFDKAIADYDAALKGDPKLAWLLYGRGLAEEKTGRPDQGRSDIAAALAIDPKLAERATRAGLSPAGTLPAPVASR